MKYLALLLAVGATLPAQQFVTGQAARAVIGQRTFTRQEPGVSQYLLGSVSGLALANNTLYVVDSSRVQAFPQNHRVLVYRDVSDKFPQRTDSITWDEVTRCPLCGSSADQVLGQPDFGKNELGTGANRLRTPTAVATDGRVLAVADTDNNRVLIWTSIPTTDGQPANVVVGQQDMTATSINAGRGSEVNERGLRGPQGVWIDARGRFWVADTQNHRVLMWNQVPRENGAPANLVLGAPDMTTFVQVDLTQARNFNATASNLLNPVSVTVDPMERVFVADLGNNRVMVWNSLPTRNGQSGDIVLGQPDVASSTDRSAQTANNSQYLCQSTGTNSAGAATYPDMCAATLNFPRFALSDGRRLFVADGGNNRVLVYNSIPTQNGQRADVVLGQPTEFLNIDATGDPDSLTQRVSSADSVRTPLSLAWDGTNLFVSDPFNRRVLVWTVGDQPLPLTGVRNAASLELFASGGINFTADPKENDEVTLKIGTGDTAREYKYKAAANQKIANVVNGLAEAINAGNDPLVLARANPSFFQLILTARAGGAEGNSVSYTVAYSAGAQITGDASGTLSRGQDATQIAPGSIVTILGERLADRPVGAVKLNGRLPTQLGGVEVYIDGIRAPLLYVSPDQINAQMPWEVNDSSSVSVYVRTAGADGRVRTTTPIAVPIIPQKPGIFATPGSEPRRALAYHGSSAAVGVVSVDGSVKAGDVATVTVADRSYQTTVAADDTLFSVRDRLVTAINEDPEVTAEPSAVFTRIVLRARTPGAAGEGLTYGASATQGGSLIMTALSPALCCANVQGAPVTDDNPARPGQLITVYTTGLGIVQPDEAKFTVVTGGSYTGPELNAPNAFIDAVAGGKTANVLFARLKTGEVGLYELVLQLNADIPTNPQTQLYIAQDIYFSNVVTFPVVNPNEVTSP